MAYSVPTPKAHGDTVSSADMQKYSDSLAAIYAAISSGKSVCFASRQKEAGSASDSFYTQIHTLRWLIYTGAGQVASFDGAHTSSLADGGGTNVYDLESVGWLSYGMPYKITGVNFAIEDAEP